MRTICPRRSLGVQGTVSGPGSSLRRCSLFIILLCIEEYVLTLSGFVGGRLEINSFASGTTLTGVVPCKPERYD